MLASTLKSIKGGQNNDIPGTSPASFTRDQILRNGRFAGEVERYHTWPTHRRQSNGEHTWQVMRIYYKIWGPLSSISSEYILWHDAGELVLGDLPFPVKRDNAGLKLACDNVEKVARYNLVGKDIEMPPLEIRRKAKICDLIEMHEFGLSELAMGNKFAQPIVDDTLQAIAKLAAEFPSKEDYQRVDEYVWRVTRELGGE